MPKHLTFVPERLASKLAQWQLIGGVSLVAALLAATMAATTSAEAATPCQRSRVCNPWNSGVNLRVWSNTSGPAKLLHGPSNPAVDLNGAGLFIDCWRYGETIHGPWSTSNIWDFVSWTTENGYTYRGYVSDTFVYTGTNGAPNWSPANQYCQDDKVGNI